jgi:hypothetical protein
VPLEAQPNADGDPLASFRYDESGKRLSDLEALQAAVWTYERMASLSPDEGQQPLAGLTDLNQLVKVRLITAVPEAPGGKRYIVNAANKQVSVP